MKKILIALLALNILNSQELEPVQNNRTLTIYKDSFAIIKEPILWNLKDGKNITSFNNLSPNIVFDSPLLNIDGVEVGSQTLNKNFYSTDSYLKKNIGSLVEVKPANNSVVQGALLRNCHPIRHPLSPLSTALTHRAGSPPSELLSPVNKLPN